MELLLFYQDKRWNHDQRTQTICSWSVTTESKYTNQICTMLFILLHSFTVCTKCLSIINWQLIVNSLNQYINQFPHFWIPLENQIVASRSDSACISGSSFFCVDAIKIFLVFIFPKYKGRKKDHSWITAQAEILNWRISRYIR